MYNNYYYVDDFLKFDYDRITNIEDIQETIVDI